MNKAIILLSGGLDSLVSLDIASKTYEVELALTFDYGQKAFLEEKEASSKIAKLYNIKHEIIELPFLNKITKNALTDENKTDFNDFRELWIPNRNGLFLNVAACYCDKFNYDYIVIGVNKKEAQHFSDNSLSFIQNAQSFFEYSTQKHPKVLAPCQTYDKIEIINYVIDNKLDLSLLKSCYNSQKNTGKKHCGECMSCKLLIEAIQQSKNPKLIEEIF